MGDKSKCWYCRDQTDELFPIHGKFNCWDCIALSPKVWEWQINDDHIEYMSVMGEDDIRTLTHYPIRGQTLDDVISMFRDKHPHMEKEARDG